MKRHLNLIVPWSLLTSLVLLGCEPPAITKPENLKPVWTAENPNADKVAQEQRSQQAARDTIGKGPSSLDALRQGRSTVTPASSPVQDIFFDFDRFDLRADARKTLQANAEWMKNNPAARVEVEGHCDERGTNEYNLALGAKRAQAARDYLLSLGIAAIRLSTISFGEEIPVCTEKAESCWQKNRRARFVITPPRPAS